MSTAVKITREGIQVNEVPSDLSELTARVVVNETKNQEQSLILMDALPKVQLTNNNTKMSRIELARSVPILTASDSGVEVVFDGTQDTLEKLLANVTVLPDNTGRDSSGNVQVCNVTVLNNESVIEITTPDSQTKWFSDWPWLGADSTDSRWYPEGYLSNLATGEDYSLARIMTPYLCSKHDYTNFVVSFEYKMKELDLPDGKFVAPFDSGVQIRSKVMDREITSKPGAPGPFMAWATDDTPLIGTTQKQLEGIQVDIPANGFGAYGWGYGNEVGKIQGEGWLGNDVNISSTVLDKTSFMKNGGYIDTDSTKYQVTGGWNKMVIMADGDKIMVWVNGELIQAALVDPEKTGANYSSGLVGIQAHGVAARYAYFHDESGVKAKIDDDGVIRTLIDEFEDMKDDKLNPEKIDRYGRFSNPENQGAMYVRNWMIKNLDA